MEEKEFEQLWQLIKKFEEHIKNKPMPAGSRDKIANFKYVVSFARNTQADKDNIDTVSL